MTTLIEQKCCDQCWHGAERLCPDLVSCLTDGPSCHVDEAGVRMRQEAVARLRRLEIAKPVIYVGAGTCGLAAGAAKTIAAIEAYVESKGLDVELVRVGCIGLCVMEPMVDFQMPGSTRVSFGAVTKDRVNDLLDKVFSGVIPEANLVGQFREEFHALRWLQQVAADQGLQGNGRFRRRHALAQAGGVTALASVNRAIVGVQSAAGGAVAWPGSIGG